MLFKRQSRNALKSSVKTKIKTKIVHARQPFCKNWFCTFGYTNICFNLKIYFLFFSMYCECVINKYKEICEYLLNLFWDLFFVLSGRSRHCKKKNVQYESNQL